MSLSKEKLIEHLKSIFEFEENLKQEYTEFAESLTNADVKGKIEYIRDCEIKHIGLAKELIEIARED